LTGGGIGGNGGGFVGVFAAAAPFAVAPGPVPAGLRVRRSGTLVELNPVLPAPYPGGLPNFGMTPTGGPGRRGFVHRCGSCWPLSSKVGRSPFGGAGSVVCAQADAPQHPASTMPTGTAKRNAE
jgi:hypothetical protein